MLWRRVLPAVMLLAVWGCGSAEEERPALNPVSGTLSINGEPAEGAMLVLHPIDGLPFDSRGSRPRATVASDGSFEVGTYQAGDGAPAGDYQVAVLWFENPDSNAPWDKLGNRYSNPKKSGIEVLVEDGPNELDPIEIEGATLQKSRPPRRRSTDHDQVD